VVPTGWIVTWQNAIPNGTELVIYPALL